MEPEWFDTTLDANCTRHETVDGGPRCLPLVYSNLAGFEQYADDACTQEVLGWAEADECFANPLPALRADIEPQGCGVPPLRNVRAVTTVTHDGPIYTKSEDTCIPADRFDAPYYLVGDNVSLEDFVVLPVRSVEGRR